MTGEESQINLPETEYEVENILDHKKRRIFNYETKRYHFIKEYLIKWAGYDETTWEPEENLQNCQELLSDYWKLVKINKLREKYRNNNNKTPKKLIKIFFSHIKNSNFMSIDNSKVAKSCFASPVRVSKNQISSNMSTLSDINSMSDLDRNRTIVWTKGEDIILSKNDESFLSKKRTKIFEDKKDLNESDFINEKYQININSKSSKNKNISKTKEQKNNVKKVILKKRIINSSQKVSNPNNQMVLLKKANKFGPSFYDVINANKSKTLGDEFRGFIQKKRKKSESLSSSFSISDPNLNEFFHKDGSKVSKRKKDQAFQSNMPSIEISQITIPTNADESINVSYKYQSEGKAIKFNGTSRDKILSQQELFDCYEEIIKRELAGKTYKFPDFFLKEGKK